MHPAVPIITTGDETKSYCTKLLLSTIDNLAEALITALTYQITRHNTTPIDITLGNWKFHAFNR